MNQTKISYVNDQDVEFYYKLYNIKEYLNSSSYLTIDASLLGGPKMSYKEAKEHTKFDKLDKLYALWDYLKAKDLIALNRPNHEDEAEGFDGKFIFEKVMAHKMYFPKPRLKNIKKLNQLVVWVAEPDHSKLSQERWEFTGTFLILIESIYDKAEFQTTISGCSALQALANILSGKPFYTINGDESFGRNNPKHPLEKLEDMGAIYLHKQNIETVYVKRYMTNEQTFIFNAREFRCNDLLGYPLFIKT